MIIIELNIQENSNVLFCAFHCSWSSLIVILDQSASLFVFDQNHV